MAKFGINSKALIEQLNLENFWNYTREELETIFFEFLILSSAKSHFMEINVGVDFENLS